MSDQGSLFSPIPNQADIEEGLRRAGVARDVDENGEHQITYLEQLACLAPRIQFPKTKLPAVNYWYGNGSYGALDAAFLAAVFDRYRPARVIEVGSGHSSACMLDLHAGSVTPDHTEFTFIDPDFSRLNKLIGAKPMPWVTKLEMRVQDVPFSLFEALQPGDVLFVDSSHVGKIGSDVLFILFEVLPRLQAGVLVHFHDVFANWEYPREWFAAGRYWNEQYLLRAFLMNNAAWKIEARTAWLFEKDNAFFREYLPASIETGGGALWIRKV